MKGSDIFCPRRTDTVLERARNLSKENPFLLTSLQNDLIDRLRQFVNFSPKTLNLQGLYTKDYPSSLEQTYPSCSLKEHSVNSWISTTPYDALISLNHLHHVHDVPGFFTQVLNQLNKQGGLFMAILFGEHTLIQLEHFLLEQEEAFFKRACPRMMPKLDIKTTGQLLQHTGFKNIVVDLQTYKASYENLTDLIRDIRTLGLSNTLKATSPPLSRQFWEKAHHNFVEGSTHTFDALVITAWT